MRRVASAAALVGMLVVPAAAGGRTVAPSSQPVFAFAGKGHGHGVGMAQDSAYAMAQAGSDREQILEHFYPGTRRGVRQGPIRVMVWEIAASTGAVVVSVPSGARVSNDHASAKADPGAVLRISVDGSGYHVREADPPARGEAIRSGLLEPTPSSTQAAPSPSPSDPVPVLPGPSASGSPGPPPQVPSPGATPASAGPSPRASSSRAASPTASPTTTAAPPLAFDSASPVTLTPDGGGVTQVGPTGRRYRGQLTAIARQGFRLVNVLDIEAYLGGLGEVPASWPQAALQTQAVAARTYAVRARQAGHPLGYDLCDDTRCQVYLGVQTESPRSATAAARTSGEVVTYQGSLADAFYSANAGGVTANPEEGFGSGTTVPYLPAGIRASGDPAAWQVNAAPADVAARLGYPGRLDTLTVTQRGPSGRVLQIRLDGAAGAVQLSGVLATRRLGLWSNLFSVTRSTGLAGALPAPGAAATQLPPALAAHRLSPLVAATAEPSAAPQAAAPAPPPADGRHDGGVVLLACILLAGSGLGVALALRDQRRRTASP